METTQNIQAVQIAPVQEQDYDFLLSDGTKVKFDEKANGTIILKARKIAGREQVNVPYIAISMMTLFNGEKYTLEQIQQLPVSDFLMLEDKWNEFCTPKKPALLTQNQ